MFVVTATLNGLDYTKRLLQSLRNVNTLDLRVIVIDNGSTDGTPEYIASLPGDIILVQHSRNTGAACAWNLGIRIALLNGADKILVCGNDTVPMPGTVERLSALIDEGIQFITGTAVLYDKPEVMVPLAQPHEPLLEAPDFSFFMFTPAVIEALARMDESLEFEVIKQCNGERPPVLMKPWDWGMFDERLSPAYFEDGDYHFRMQKAGLLALRDPGAEFRHETSLTIRINPEVGRLNQQQTFAQNANLFRAKWGGLPHEVEAQPGSNKRPIGARPLNVSPEQWAQMSGGHPVAEMSREDAIAQAKAVYGKYGIAV